MQSQRLDITIEQGATYRQVIQWLQGDGITPVGLSGYTGAAKIKSAFGGTTLATATVTLNNSTGEITVELSAATTAALAAPAKGVWDLLLTAGDGTKFRLLEGTVSITPGVSHG